MKNNSNDIRRIRLILVIAAAPLLIAGGVGLFVFLHSPAWLFRRFPPAQYHELWATPVRWYWGHSGYLGQYDCMAQPAGGLIFSDPFNTYFIGPNGENWTPPDMADGYAMCINRYALNPQGGLFLGTGLLGLDGKMRWEHSISDFPNYEIGDGLSWFVGPEEIPYAYQQGSVWEMTQTGRIKRRLPSELPDCKVLDSRLVGDDLLLVTQQLDQPSISLRRLDGSVLWSESWGAIDTPQPRILADGTVFYSAYESGPCLVRMDGQRAWTLDSEGRTEGCVFGSGILGSLQGRRLSFLKPDGSPARPAVTLPTGMRSYAPARQALLTGRDGRFYLTTATFPIPGLSVAGYILAFDAGGEPLWQMQLSKPAIAPVAIDPAGRVYGLRLLREVSANRGYSSDWEAELVCFEPAP